MILPLSRNTYAKTTYDACSYFPSVFSYRPTESIISCLRFFLSKAHCIRYNGGNIGPTLSIRVRFVSNSKRIVRTLATSPSSCPSRTSFLRPIKRSINGNNHRTMCRESQISLIITVSVIIDLKDYRARLFFFRCAHNDDRLVIFSFSITATLFLTLVGYVKHNSRFTQSSGCCFTRDSFRFNRVPFAISFFVDRTHRVAISNDTPLVTEF